jgi:hypothetical protein
MLRSLYLITMQRRRVTDVIGCLKELAERYPTDRQAYLDGKGPFIEGVLVTARSKHLGTRVMRE